MSLFKLDIDPEFEYARGGTSHIVFLDRSPRKSVRQIREKLDNWFDRFPAAEQQRLRSDFRSRNNRTHVSALFELYCHELLLQLGFGVSMHEREASGRAKDFRCVRGSAEIDFEATLSTEPTTDEQQSSNTTKVLDYINKHGFTPGFRYALEELTEGKNPPPLKKLAGEIRDWAGSFNRAALRKLLEPNDVDRMPVGSFGADDWVIDLRLLPRPADEFAVPTHPRSIGIGPITSEFWSDDRSLRNTLKSKARHYRERNLPLVIGVDVWLEHRMIDEIDVFQALLGTEVIRYKFNGLQEPQTVFARDSDGLWVGPKGIRNRHVGAVMIVPNLLPWTIHTSRPTVYAHPQSSPHFLPSDLDLDTVTWSSHSGDIERAVGRSPEDLFQLPPDWLDED